MKITILKEYQKGMLEIAEALGELMADLEDVRDEAQELLDEKDSDEIRADIRKMDEALEKLEEVASELETDDE